MPYVQANEVRLFYEDFGAGDEPLLLVHGFTCTHQWWLETIRYLPSNKFRILAFDTRGVGHSDRPATGYTPMQCAEDILQGALNLGFPEFTFVGQSMGALTGIWLALHHAASLRRLVLVGPAPSTGVHGATDLVNEVRTARKDPAAYRRILPKWLGETRQLEPGLEDLAVQAGTSCSDDYFDQSWAAMTTLDLSEHLSEITTPTMMILGDRDMFRDEQLRDAGRIPNCALHVFYGVGHEITWDVPEQFAHVVVDFIENVPSKSCRAP